MSATADQYPDDDLRTLVKARLVDVLAPLLATAGQNGTAVPVDYGHPGDTLQREHVFLDQVDGSLEIPLLGRPGEAKQYDDEFSLDVVIACYRPGHSARDAELRVGSLWKVVFTELRTNLQLGLTIADGLQYVEITRRRGPVSLRTDQGWQAVTRATLTFHTRHA